MRRANVAMAKSDWRYVDSQLCQTYGAPEVSILVSHSHHSALLPIASLKRSTQVNTCSLDRKAFKI